MATGYFISMNFKKIGIITVMIICGGNITIKLVETYGRLVLCFISAFLFYIFSHKLLFKIPFRGKKNRVLHPLETEREIEEV